MGRIGLAFQSFFKILFNGEFAERARKLVVAPAGGPVAPVLPGARPARSEALNLLAVLQREGRLVDFLKEDLSAYSDAQIGAAARDVHRDCAEALERIFALRAVRAEAEGASIQVPAGFDAASLRLTGNVAGQPPFRGILRHAGWQSTRADLPEWSGPAQSANVVAPAEVEIA